MLANVRQSSIIDQIRANRRIFTAFLYLIISDFHVSSYLVALNRMN